MHHPRVPELAHAGIDNRVAGSAALPGGKRSLVVSPAEFIKGMLEIARREIGHVEQQVPAEFAPRQFAQELVDVACEPGTLGGGKTRGVPDLPRADLAEPQVR